MAIVVGLFNVYEYAEQAIEALWEAGFSESTVSIKTQPEVISRPSTHELIATMMVGVIGGILFGSLLGLLLFPNEQFTLLQSLIAGAIVGGVGGAVSFYWLATRNAPSENEEIIDDTDLERGYLVRVHAHGNEIIGAYHVLEKAEAVTIDVLKGRWQASEWGRYSEEIKI